MDSSEWTDSTELEAVPLVPMTSQSGVSEEQLATHSPSSASHLVFWRLYLSHFLSSWNSRMFEFGAVLFLAHAFPGTLLYSSLYALCRASAAVILSSYIGGLIDRTDRLVAIRHSIGDTSRL